ncbi:hypothetical protein CEUSTIGMA_g5598.t1 [Chlamydomonas eustigma]|uniref:Uncharacterized protein n=1 Tax=Chlamydomonas eustigma TaxID=1157962 RepID=A0A250X535_9CHLO|nr:hypothetical protein CEUSTIGMA_g5598.t1 [Chlamydomonas eustigma]|eukprot:GAX78156.1 hypothetical protein CEUSTIGMA_g5598.t1 [Chlamydomonas eustigma]
MDNPENFRPEGLQLSESYAKSRNENSSLSERSISSAILCAKRALWPQHARKTGPLVDVKGEQKDVIGNQPLSGHSAVADSASIPQQETSMTSAGNCKPMSQEDASEQERIPTSKVERRSTTLPNAELFKLRQHRLWAHRDSSCSPQGMARRQVDQALGLLAQRCVGQIGSTSSDMPPGALPPPSSDYHNCSEAPSCTATTSSGGASMTQEGAHATRSHAMRLPRPSQTSLITSSGEEDNTSGSDLSILTGSERSRLMRHPKTLRQHRLWRRRDSAASPQGRAQRCVKQLLVDIGASAIARRRRRAEQHVQTAKKAGVTDGTTVAGSTTGAGSTTSPLPSEASYPVSAQTDVNTLKYGSRPPDSETGTCLSTGSISGPTSQVCSTSLAFESTELHARCSAVVHHSMLGKLQRHRLWRGRDSAASPTGRAQKQVTEALKIQARDGSTGHTSSNASVAGTELASMISDMPSEASKLQIKVMESNSGNQLSSAAAAAAAASTLQRLRGHRLWKGRNSTASPEGRARSEVEQALQILAKEGVSKTPQLDSGVISSGALTSSHASSMQGRITGLAFSQRDVVSSSLSEEAQPLDRAEGLLGSTQSMEDHASSVVQRHASSVVQRHASSVVQRHASSVVQRHASSVVQRHTQVLIASPRGTVIKAGGETEEIGIQGVKKGAESSLPCMKHIGNDQGSSHSSSSSNEGPLAAERVRQALGRIRQHRLWKKRESSASPTGRARRQVEQALRLGLGGAVARRQKQLGVTGADAPETYAASQTVQAAVLGTNAAAAANANAQRSRRRDDFTQSATSSQTPRTSAPGSSDITVMSNVMSYAPSVSQEATEDSHYDTRHLIVEPPQQLGSDLGGRHQDLPRYRSVAESHLLPTPSSSMRTSTDGWTASEVTAAPASPSRLTPSDHALLMMKASAIDLPSSSVAVGSSLHSLSGDALSVLEQGRAARELTRRRANEAEALRRLRKHRLWRERDSSASLVGRVRNSVEKALRLLLSQHQSQGVADPGQGAMIDAYASTAWESGSVSAVSGSQVPVIMAESAAAAAAASCAIPTNRTGGARMLSSILPTQGFKHVTAPIVAAEAPAPISPLAPSPPSLPSALDESNQLLLRNDQGIILGRKDFHTSSIWDASAIAENQKMFESRAFTGRSMYPGSTLHHNWQYSDWWLSRWSRDTPNPICMNTQAAEEAELLHLWPSSEGGKQHPPEASTAVSDAVGPGLFPGLSSALLGPPSIQAELAEQTLGTRHCLKDSWTLQCTTPDVMLQQLPDERPSRHAAEASLSEVPMLVGSISTTRSSAPPLSRQVSDLSDRLRAIASSVAQYVLKSPAASSIPHPFAPNSQESTPRQRPTSTPGTVEREKLSGVHLEDKRLLQYHDPRKCASVSGIEEELDSDDKGAGPCSVLDFTVTLQPGELATATLQPSDQVTASLPRTLPPAPPMMDQRVELPEIMPELVVAAAEVVVVSTAAATVSRRAKSLRANLDGFLSTLSEQLITMDHDSISTEEHVVKGATKTLLVSDVHREENLSNGDPVGIGGAPDAAAAAVNDNGSSAIPNATDTSASPPASGTITVVPRSATTTTSTADTAGALTAAATASGLIAILGQLKQVGSNGRRLSSQLSGAGATKDVVGKGNEQHGANDQQAAAGDEAATSRAPAFILPAAPPPSPDPGAMAPSKITPIHLTYHTPAAAASALLPPSTVLPGTSAAATAAPSTSQSAAAAAATAALSMVITSPPHPVSYPLTSNMITEAIMTKSFQYPASYPSTSSASVPHLHLTANTSGSALLSSHSNVAPGIGSNSTRIAPSASRQDNTDAAQPPPSAPLASSSVDRQVHNVTPPLKASAEPMGGTALAAPSSTASSSRNSSVHTLTQPFKGLANIKDSVGVSSTSKLTVEDVLKKLKVEREQQQAAGRRYKQYSVHGHRDTAAAAATCRGGAGKAVSSRRPSIAAPLLAVQELSRSNGAVSMSSLLIPSSKRVTSTLSSKHQGGISEHGAGLTTSSKKDNVYIPPRRLSLVKQPSGLGVSGWEKDGEVIKDQLPQHHASSNISRSPVVQVRPFTASAEAVAAELASSWSNIGLNPKPAEGGDCDERSPFQPWSLEPSSLTVTSMAKKMSRGSHRHDDFVTPAVNVIKSTAPAANDNDTVAKHAVFTPVMGQHLHLDPEDAFGGFREGEVPGLQHLHSIAAPGAGEEEALHFSQSLSSLHGWCSGRVLHNTVEDHGNGRMPTLDTAVPHPSGSDQVLSSDDSSLSLQAALDMEPPSQMTQQHPLHKVDQIKGSDQGASPTPMLLTLQALSPALHRSPSRTAALRYNQQQESSADSTPSTQQQLPLPKWMQPEGFRHEAQSLASLPTQTPIQRILHDDHFAAPAPVISPFSWMVEEAELAASLAVAAATSKRSMQHVEVPSSPTLFSSSLVVSTNPASQSTPSLSVSKITFSTPSSSTLTTPATGLNYSTPQDDNDERYSEISSASGPAAVLQSKLHELHSKAEPSTDSARAELSGWQNEGMLTRASLIVAQEAVGTVLSSLKSGPGVHTSGYIKSGYPTEGFVKRVPGVSSTLFNSSDMPNSHKSRIVNHVNNHDIVLGLNGFAKGAGAILSSVMHKGRDDTSGIAEDHRVATAQLLSKLSSMNANTILMRKHMESSMGK